MSEIEPSAPERRRRSWRAIGRDALFFVSLVAFYLLVAIFVLPRLGFET